MKRLLPTDLAGTGSATDILPGKAGLVTERDITYDRSGNLLTLKRYDSSSGTTPSESLSYTYSGPKRGAWTYDAHANVTVDPQGGMSIAWNALDLPRTLTAGTASTERSYLADGSLAQVGNGTTTRLYLGDMVFDKASNGTVTLESAGWEGGRLLPGAGIENVLYAVTDHLGSVRVVKDGSGAVRQRFDYYPFGTVSRVWTSDGADDRSEKRYRFGGKKVAGAALTDLAGTGSAPGAPYLDFGARLYSPRTAAWLSPDPLAEKYYGIGPYVFCGNNPVIFIDPDGRDWVESKDGTVKWRDDVYLQISGDYSYVVGLQKGETYRGKVYRRFENIGDKTYNDVIYNPDKSITSSTKERPDIDGVVTSDEALDWYHYGGGKPLTVDISKFEFKTSNLTVQDFTSRNKTTLSVNFFNIFDIHVFSSDILYRPASDKTLSHVYGTIRLSLLDATTGEVRVVTKNNGSFDTYDFGVLAGIVAKTQRSYGNPKPFDFFGIGTGYIKLKK